MTKAKSTLTSPRQNGKFFLQTKKTMPLAETIITYDSLKGLESVIQIGMQERLTSTLEKLGELLLTRHLFKVFFNAN